MIFTLPLRQLPYTAALDACVSVYVDVYLAHLNVYCMLLVISVSQGSPFCLQVVITAAFPQHDDESSRLWVIWILSLLHYNVWPPLKFKLMLNDFLTAENQVTWPWASLHKVTSCMLHEILCPALGVSGLRLRGLSARVSEISQCLLSGQCCFMLIYWLTPEIKITLRCSNEYITLFK